MVIILTLSEFLHRNRLSRKIFGKMELEIIMKQLKGRRLKQSERNRLSRDIKPKLEFIREAAKHVTEFSLRKNQDNKMLAEKTVAAMLEDPLQGEIQAILLFGSFADNSYTGASDIDICAVFKKIALKEATEFRMRISGQLLPKVDVQVFNILPQKVKRSIARNHKVLFKKADYDNIDFSIRHLKEEGYFLRMRDIFGAKA